MSITIATKIGNKTFLVQKASSCVDITNNPLARETSHQLHVHIAKRQSTDVLDESYVAFEQHEEGQ